MKSVRSTILLAQSIKSRTMRNSLRFSRKVLLMLICCTLLLILTFFSVVDIKKRMLRTREAIVCYRIKTNDTLPDISEVTPRRGKSIFFHETSCYSYFKGRISITARQACAVESAARFNPNFEIYLLYSSPGMIKFDGDESDKILQNLLTYPNVYIMHLDYEKYTKGTPVERLYASGRIEGSMHAISHSSDVLRYLTMWKYGGVYLDLDVVMLKSVEDLRNFAAIESEEVVASGALGFDPSGDAHDMVEKCLNDLNDNFNGEIWGYNGPGVITRLLRNLCGTNKTDEMSVNDCGGFHVLETESFYPISWRTWWMYFDEKFADNVTYSTQHAYAIHVWNKLSSERLIPIQSNAPYLDIARKHCPKTVQACDNYF
ncbi:unnamed protein product [Phyllotreta striolata]|uniref:Alpha 1,4-glycosyltransferase domain-containing protein n=1 Tax=Phyllotreta striolata TaxID=444603 RepID=A0A9N9XSX0_PHYSR|nr:unnamed protein product [Phyllotreta striolata]